MKNRLLEKYRSGKKTIGTFTHMKSCAAIDALGYTGLDYVVIDMEHSPVGIESAADYISAAQAANLTPIVRVDGISRSSILRPLDVGAEGLIIPCVETVEQMKQIIHYAKYMPIGSRGYCMTRDGGWGFAEFASKGLEGYMDICNEQALLLPQCETLGCLENIEQITALEGVDGIMVGPYDLSIAMGVPGQFDDPDFKAAVKRIFDACKTNGKIAIIFTGNPADAKQYLEDGFDSVVVGLDIIVYINSYKSMVDQVMK